MSCVRHLFYYGVGIRYHQMAFIGMNHSVLSGVLKNLLRNYEFHVEIWIKNAFVAHLTTVEIAA